VLPRDFVLGVLLSNFIFGLFKSRSDIIKFAVPLFSRTLGARNWICFSAALLEIGARNRLLFASDSATTLLLTINWPIVG